MKVEKFQWSFLVTHSCTPNVKKSKREREQAWRMEAEVVPANHFKQCPLLIRYSSCDNFLNQLPRNREQRLECKSGLTYVEGGTANLTLGLTVPKNVVPVDIHSSRFLPSNPKAIFHGHVVFRSSTLLMPVTHPLASSFLHFCTGTHKVYAL